jgi:prepilin-type N-terminal cleavage/methylation domain-containing protein
MNKKKGFSLIELLIVVAIILIIAAIAIPNLLRSRIAANEASATATMRTLTTSEITYAYNSGFTSNLTMLGTPGAGNQPTNNLADLVDPILAGNGPGGTATSFTKNGYVFTYSTPGQTYPQISSYAVNGDPMARGSSGQRSFFSDQSAVVHANATAQATASDNPI